MNAPQSDLSTSASTFLSLDVLGGLARLRPDYLRGRVLFAARDEPVPRRALSGDVAGLREQARDAAQVVRLNEQLNDELSEAGMPPWRGGTNAEGWTTAMTDREIKVYENVLVRATLQDGSRVIGRLDVTPEEGLYHIMRDRPSPGASTFRGAIVFGYLQTADRPRSPMRVVLYFRVSAKGENNRSDCRVNARTSPRM